MGSFDLSSFKKKLKFYSFSFWRKIFKTKFPVTFIAFFFWTLFCSLFSAYFLSTFIIETQNDFRWRRENSNTRFIHGSKRRNSSSHNSLNSQNSLNFNLNSPNFDDRQPPQHRIVNSPNISLISNDSSNFNDSFILKDSLHLKNVSFAVQNILDSEKFQNFSHLNSNINIENGNFSKYGLRPCLENELSILPPYHPFGYLMVICNGGLNQQRAAICNAAVLARSLNLSLIIPHLQPHPVWGDDSDFEDIFNLDHFIAKLKGIVHVVDLIPRKVLARKLIEIQNLPVDRNATLEWYQRHVSDSIRNQVDKMQFKESINQIPPLILLDPFARRLANDLAMEWQQLRCRVNYHALEFNSEIKQLSSLMMKRMQAVSKKYVSLHFRFEMDALAYSMCDYGGGEKERKLFQNYRHEHWASGMQRMREKLDPRQQRQKGQCPLTPKEVVLFMKSMNIKNTSVVYVAALEDKLYESAKSLTTLKKAFPNLVTKKSLVSNEELSKFEGKASSLAALDYVMCVESDIYVPTSTGQFTNMVLGERIYRGHRKSYQPHLSFLAQELSKFNKTNWKQVKLRLRGGHRLRLGKPKPRARFRSFFSNPTECLCREDEYLNNKS